jgi:integrase
MGTDAISPLRQRMIEDMSARKLNPHTQRIHISNCKRFAAYLKRSPDTATAGEVVRLRVGDIDSAQNIIRIVQAKGRKDRHVMLSPETLDLLRRGIKHFHGRIVFARAQHGSELANMFLFEQTRDFGSLVGSQGPEPLAPHPNPSKWGLYNVDADFTEADDRPKKSSRRSRPRPRRRRATIDPG